MSEFLRDERGSAWRIFVEILGVVTGLLALWEFGARAGVVPGLSPFQIGQEVVNEWPNWPFDSNGGGGIDDGIELATPTGFEWSNLNCEDNSVDLSWNAVSGAAEYWIIRDGFPAPDDVTSNTSITLDLVPDGETHDYTVVAVALPAESEPSEALSITDC